MKFCEFTTLENNNILVNPAHIALVAGPKDNVTELFFANGSSQRIHGSFEMVMEALRKACEE